MGSNSSSTCCSYCCCCCTNNNNNDSRTKTKSSVSKSRRLLCYKVIPMILSTLAWAAALTQDGCDYIKLTGPIIQSSPGYHPPPYLEFGFTGFRVPKYDENTDTWSIDYMSPCNDYNTDAENVIIDTYWDLGKLFAFLALVFGGGGTVFFYFSSCVVFSKGTLNFNGCLLLFASIFQCLTFIWFKTDLCQNNTCTLHYGSISDIVSSVLWLVSSLLILCRPHHHHFNDDDDDDDEYDGDDDGNNNTDENEYYDEENNTSSSNSTNAENNNAVVPVVATFVIEDDDNDNDNDGNDKNKRRNNNNNNNNNNSSNDRTETTNYELPIEGDASQNVIVLDSSTINTKISETGEFS